MSIHYPPSPTTSPSPHSPASPTVPIHRSATTSSSRPPPVIAADHLSPQPQFAELLTPQKLRRRKRQQVPENAPVAVPLTAGPSNHGFYTDDGVYRGSATDPTHRPFPIDDDAITFSGSSSTSSSSTGGLDRAMAVFERFGTVIGVRRGSGSSGSTISGSHLERRSRRLTRTSTAETVVNGPKRQYLPRKREFVLLLPPSKETSTKSRGSVSSQDEREQPPERLVTTNSLPIVIEHIKRLRTASGMLPETLPETPDIPRPRPKMPRGSASFAPPPIPHRPTRSRLQTLREVPVRPKSVSDLLGVTNSYGSSPNLGVIRSGEFPLPSRVGTPMKEDVKGQGKEKGCWWLDVSCPTWEDLRDLGEVSGSHRSSWILALIESSC